MENNDGKKKEEIQKDFEKQVAELEKKGIDIIPVIDNLKPDSDLVGSKDNPVPKENEIVKQLNTIFPGGISPDEGIYAIIADPGVKVPYLPWAKEGNELFLAGGELVLILDFTNFQLKVKVENPFGYAWINLNFFKGIQYIKTGKKFLIGENNKEMEPKFAYIEISLREARLIYQEPISQHTKQIFEKRFGKEALKKDMSEVISNWNDVESVVGRVRLPYMGSVDVLDKEKKSINAMVQLMAIAKAYNEGREASWNVFGPEDHFFVKLFGSDFLIVSARSESYVSRGLYFNNKNHLMDALKKFPKVFLEYFMA